MWIMAKIIYYTFNPYTQYIAILDTKDSYVYGIEPKCQSDLTSYVYLLCIPNYTLGTFAPLYCIAVY